MSFRQSSRESEQDFIVGVIIDHIEGMSRKNLMRELYADTLSSNNWRNKLFEGLCVDIIDNADVLFKRMDDGRSNENDILRKAVQVYVDGHFYNVVTDGGAVIGARQHEVDDIPNDIWNEMSRLAEEWEHCLSRGGNRRHPGGGSSYANHTSTPIRIGSSGGKIQVGGYEPPPTHREANSGITSRASGAWDSLIPDSAANRRVVEPEVVEEPVQSSPRHVSRRPTHPEGIDYSKARAFDSFYQDGEHWMIPSVCTDKLTYDDKGIVIPSLYDINKQIQYYVKSQNGSVREEFTPMTTDSRYLQQELRHQPTEVQQRTGYRNPLGGVTTETPLVKKESPDIPLTKVLGVVGNSPTLSTAFDSTFTFVMSNKEIAVTGQSMLVKLESNELFATKGCVIGDPLFLQPSDVPVAEKFLLDIANSTTLGDAHQVLVRNADKIPEMLFNKVNERFSSFIKNSSRYQWQFGLKSFDFAEHFDKLTEAVLKHQNETLANTFFSRMNAIIIPVVWRTAPGEFADTVNKFLDKPDMDGVLFQEYAHVLCINKTADELGIGKQLENSPNGVAIKQNLDNLSGEAVSALRKVFQAMALDDVERNVVPLKVVTKEGRLFNIYPYMLRMTDYIITEVNLNA